MGKPESAYKKKDARKSPVGLAAVGTFTTRTVAEILPNVLA